MPTDFTGDNREPPDPPERYPGLTADRTRVYLDRDDTGDLLPEPGAIASGKGTPRDQTSGASDRERRESYQALRDSASRGDQIAPGDDPQLPT